METIKEFSQTLINRAKHLLSSGDVHRVNEIQANIFVGAVMIVIGALLVICVGLNEIGVFTADKTSMRLAALIAIVLSIPAHIVENRTHGEGKSLKYILSTILIMQCGAIIATLGHNATLVMVIPSICAIRYYDEHFMGKVFIISTIVFLLSAFCCAESGILNLNVLHPASGTEIVVGDSLRQSLLDLGLRDGAYVKSYILNDFLPRMVIFFLISFICARLAKRGREMQLLMEETSEKTYAIKAELNMAAEIQSSLLPVIYPAFPKHEEFELCAVNYAAKEVGGDFYDYFEIDDDHVAIVMADVSGKGISAALFMAISKTVLMNQLILGLGPAEAMSNANKQLCEVNSAGLFVTTWLGIYEISTGILRYCNAGHNPPIIAPAGKPAQFLQGRNGFVLAGLDMSKYTQSEIQLHAGDKFFLYTDGVTEATSPQEELYGDDRLLEIIEKNRDSSPKDLLNLIKTDLDAFSGEAGQFDDITMMGINVHSA